MHVVQRGHDRGACFLDDAERELYLGLLQEHSGRHGCRIHAYVLMTNHVHLLVTSDDGWGVSRLVKHVSQRYVQRFNAKYRRVGSLWQGRFYSSIVESDDYYLACQRYIELNPVRARMVPHPALYPWSSFAHNALGSPSLFLVSHESYRALGPSDQCRLAAYRSLFESDLAPDMLQRIRAAIAGNLPLGSERFVADLEDRLGVRTQRRKPGPAPKTRIASSTEDLFAG